METVEVVIKIPKRSYESIISYKGKCLGLCDNAVKVGTVLPKGHGALKDYHGIRSEYIRKMSITMSTEFRMSLLCGIIDDAPTVIEADREVEDEGSGV